MTPPSQNHDKRSLKDMTYLVRQNFAFRRSGLPVLGLVVALAIYPSREPVYWMMICAHFLIWPYLARAVTARSAEQDKMEGKNLYIDACMCGMWIPIIDYSPFATLLLVVINAVNIANVRGLRYGIIGLILVGIGVLASLLFPGTEVPVVGSEYTDALAVTVIVVYLTITASFSRNLRTKIVAARGDLSESRSRYEALAAVLAERNLLLDSALLREQNVSRLKEDFLASLNHELRTPLNAITGLAEALQEEVYGPLSEMQRKSLVTIENSGHDLLKLIVDMMDFTRIGAGKLSTDVQSCDPKQLVQAAARHIREQVAQKNLNLSLSLFDEEVVIRTDPDKCQRVLSSLLSNAAKFTPEGGNIGLDLTFNEAEQIVLFSIWDTGIGLSAGDLQKLAQPFVQADSGLARKYGGLGLGLALCTRLSHLIGANLAVESNVGEGSRFTLTVHVAGPRRITIYSDLNCPFSYTLNQWLAQMRLSHLVDWQGVEHMVGLTKEQAQSEEEQSKLLEELERLEARAEESHVVVCRPEYRVNSQLALVALCRIEHIWPERSVEVRELLFKAIWRDGLDIGDIEVINELLLPYNIGDLTHADAERAEVAARTDAWRNKGYDCIPMAVSYHSQALYKGLGHRGLLLSFVKEEMGFLGAEEGTDLTRRLALDNINSHIDYERGKSAE
jgi:signal transduction histidine kinase/2-hydroxychromene-2-carboxylate isomerase